MVAKGKYLCISWKENNAGSGGFFSVTKLFLHQTQEVLLLSWSRQKICIIWADLAVPVVWCSWLVPAEFTFTAETESWAGVPRQQLYPVCSLQCLSLSNAPQLKPVFGEAQTLSRSNGYGFSPQGHLRRLIQSVLLRLHAGTSASFHRQCPASSWNRIWCFQKKKNWLKKHTAAAMQDIVLLDEPWLSSGRCDHPKLMGGGGKPSARAEAEEGLPVGAQGQH